MCKFLVFVLVTSLAGALIAFASGHSTAAWIAAIAAAVAAFLLVAFIPTFIAFSREHPHRWPIFCINFFLGGLLIGWVGALVWALITPQTAVTAPRGFANRIEPTI